MKNLLLLFLFSCLVYPLFAQTPDANGVLYVKEGGNGSGNSWSTALGNLGTALDAARSNTAIKQIWVAKGSYQPASGQYFSMVKGVKIYGHFAGTETSLSQRNLASTDTSFLKANGSRVISNDNNNLTKDDVLDGFVVTAAQGDAIFNKNSSPAFTNMTIQGNEGAGLSNNSSNPVLTNVVISGNADGGMYNTNNSSPILTNVVISGNAATEGIGGIMNYNSTPQIRNSIILGNQWGSIKDQDGSNTVITNSLVQGVEADAAKGNLDGTTFAPGQVFVSPVYSPPTTAGDYRLKAGSPALDHGNNSLYEVADGNENNNSVNSDKDVAGNPRLFNNIIDMGAYESQGFPEIEISGNGVVITRSNTPSATNSTDWGYSALGLSTTNTFTIRNIGAQPLYIASARISGVGNTNDFSITKQPASTVPAGGSTTFELTFKPSFNGVHAEAVVIESSDADEERYSVLIIGAAVTPDANGVLYVKEGGSHGGNGSGNSWNNAVSSFAGALDFARGNTAVKQIWVAKGSYQPASGKSFSMVKGVKVYGHFAGTETSLSQRNLASTDTSFLKGNGSGVISNDDNNLTTDDVLDGFVVTAAQGDAIFNKNSSPAFTNMIIRGNEGAGLSNNNSNPVLTNVVIVGNYGSGLYNQGSKPLLMNVTISGNSTGETGGAMINYSSIPDIRNSIILGNKFGIDNWDGSSLVVTHSLVEGTEADAAKGNLDGNSITAGQVFKSPASYDLVPTTTGDYRLKPGSPAINKGSNSLYEAADGDENNHSADTDKDLAGNPRLAAGTIDLGAYESQAFPEINIQGNAVSITDGDATPSAADSTNFGSQNIATGSIIRTYTIQNTGDDTLFVSSVTIGGAAAADYSISSAAADTVLAGTATSFAIRFDPSERGARNAIITVNSNDADEAVYDFAVTGEGIAATAISFSPASSKTYGDEDFELNAGSNSPEPVGYSSSNTAVATVYQNTDNNKWYAKVVGAGTATITASQNAGSSYSAGKADAVVTVDKAILTIKANGQSKVYGDADPAFTKGATGFKNNDNNKIITGSLKRAERENAGKYAICQKDQ
ncbi:MAG: choice-of-anchor D domain-containing protein, partial [Agriterribacter sp.]